MKEKIIDLIKLLAISAKNYIKKKWWYILLVIASSIYVTYYRYEIYEIDQFNARSLIFIIWLVLLALPLFSEIEIGNIKIKKEVEKTQAEIKDCIRDLQMQIMSMRVSNSNNNTIMVGQLASESELNDMRNSVKEGKSDNQNNETCMEEKVPEQTIYLLSVRRTLERELYSLCRPMDVEGHISVGMMIKLAVKNKLIDMNTADILRQINGIANRSIHGEIVSEEYVSFVRETFPEMKKRIEKAKLETKENTWFCCTRCHYSGPSEYDNVCPNCGFVTDDE